jgi:hypothetical protein
LTKQQTISYLYATFSNAFPTKRCFLYEKTEHAHLLAILISTSMNAMESAAGVPAGANPTAIVLSPTAPAALSDAITQGAAAGTEMQSMTSIAASKSYRQKLADHSLAEVEIQAVSDNLENPLVSRDTSWAWRAGDIGTGIASLIAGAGLAKLVIMGGTHIMPQSLSRKTRARILLGAGAATSILASMKVNQILRRFLDRHLVPGGVPAGATWQEREIAYPDEQDGQQRTRTVGYYASPKPTEPAARPKIISIQEYFHEKMRYWYFAHDFCYLFKCACYGPINNRSDRKCRNSNTNQACRRY